MEIKVSDLICQTMRYDQVRGCMNISANISDSIIKVASTRIFSEPEQSFMELVVNSIDSYRRMEGKPSTGKFGMGFFSMLYWLTEDPSRTLYIVSKSKDQNQYKVALKWTLGGLIISYMEPNLTDKDRHQDEDGTAITLECKESPLTDENILAIKKNIDRLSNIKDISIKYNGEQVNTISSDKGVSIVCFKKSVLVNDYAEGITQEVLLNALLIPSSSTKQRIYNTPTSIEYPIITENSEGKSVLMITVNNISIIRIEKTTNPGFNYILKMPPNTLLPVARDDIIYEKDSIEHKSMMQQLKLIFGMAIGKLGDTISLLDLLNDYEAYSQQLVLTDILINFKAYTYTIPTVIYIPKGAEAYSVLKRQYPQMRLVYHPTPQIDISEKKIDTFLDNIASKDIFKLKKIVILPIKEVYETGELSSYLFVSEVYTHQDNWIHNLVSVSKNTLLIPVNVKNDNFYEYIDRVNRFSYSKSFENAVKTLIMTWVAKTQNLVFGSIDERYYIMNIINIRNVNENDLISLITHFNNKISKINFTYSYGSSKIVTVNYEPIIYTDNFEKKNYEVDDIINKEYYQFLKTLNLALAHWYIDIWMNQPTGQFIIPTYQIFDVQSIYSEENAGKIRSQFVRELIEGVKQCLTQPEILTFLHIMYTYDKNYNGENDIGIGMFCLREIRHRCSPEELHNMAVSVFIGYVNNRSILIKIVNPVLLSLKLYSQKRVTFHINSPLGDKFTFTCKSLISYIYNRPAPVTMTHESLQLVEQYSHSLTTQTGKLQIVEIAINEGTTKNYVQAVLTELIQNSIDAIRSSKLEGEIDINLYTDSINITDNVGIPNEAYMALLIPFLSSKNPNDPNVTGEMGTGFFNVYRQPLCSVVTIHSNEIFIEATPIINEQGYVIDIQYSISINPMSRKKGTSISIFFHPDKADIIESITDAHIYATNYLGFTGIKTYLNGNIIEEKRSLIIQNNLGSVYITSNPNIQSFIMTNGVPFASLSSFASQFPDVFQRFLTDGNTRVIINFNKNIYTPSQSRTKVNIPFKLRRDISTFINDGLYLAVLHMYNQGEIQFEDSIIENTTSQASIFQLKFTVPKRIYDILAPLTYKKAKTLRNLYVNYLPTGKKPLFKIINEYIDSSIPLSEDIISQSVLKWAKNKNQKRIIEETVLIRTFEAPHEVKGALSVPFTSLQPFINLYWDICKKLIHEGVILNVKLGTPPSIVIGETVNENVKGFYTHSQNIIFLNDKYFSKKDIDLALKETKDVYGIRINCLMASLFSPSLPVTTLIHEILHAIQGEDHTISSHGTTNIKIMGFEELSFDECAQAIYEKVLEEGIMKAFLTSTF